MARFLPNDAPNLRVLADYRRPHAGCMAGQPLVAFLPECLPDGCWRGISELMTLDETPFQA